MPSALRLVRAIVIRLGGIVKSADEASDVHIQDQLCLRIIHDVSEEASDAHV